MKTKNAFAFRDFDSSYILFRKKLYVIKVTHEHLTKFRHLINRHNEQRLVYFYRKQEG